MEECYPNVNIFSERGLISASGGTKIKFRRMLNLKKKTIL